MDHVLKKEFLISSYHLDPGRRARVTAMANFFQEMAYHHANILGFGYRDLKQRNTMWVLSRMKIRIDRYPIWDETVTVETWHRGMERLFGIRDFRIRDSGGDPVAVASSAWLIVDMNTRRPVRPDDRTLHHSGGEEAVFSDSLDKIDLPAGFVEMGGHDVVYSDLDIIGHVNNVKYIEWCIDSAVPATDSNHEISGFEINFMHEALPGDHIVISGNSERPESSYFVAHRQEGGQEIFRARIVWK
jgi:acyl-ACP thioesterase